VEKLLEKMLTTQEMFNKIQQMDTLGKEILTFRKEKRITLRALANTVKVSPSLLSLIEHGKQKPGKELIVKLALELDADADKWCGLAGMITPEAESRLADLAREDPMFFRGMVNRFQKGMS
jgi:transcriptional regulator with XRE-family HTH domain